MSKRTHEKSEAAKNFDAFLEEAHEEEKLEEKFESGEKTVEPAPIDKITEAPASKVEYKRFTQNGNVDFIVCPGLMLREQGFGSNDERFQAWSKRFLHEQGFKNPSRGEKGEVWVKVPQKDGYMVVQHQGKNVVQHE